MIFYITFHISFRKIYNLRVFVTEIFNLEKSLETSLFIERKKKIYAIKFLIN